MLIATIQASDYNNAKKQIYLALDHADGIELRLDYSKSLDFKAIAILRSEFTLPMIFTLRKKSQGGLYPNDEAQRLQDILSLCKLEPDYVDLEYDIPNDFLQKISSLHPKIKLICSYHNFSETPADLTSILQLMKHHCFHTYKIATKAQLTVDALRMMQFVKSMIKKFSLTGICMGEYGMTTRILGPIMGNNLHYASVSKEFATAPGQLTLSELLNIYHFRNLNSSSKIYALLGNPIDTSVGHLLHNQAMNILNENAVYIKLNVSPKDLQQIIILLRELPFGGFSITMPLKEIITPYLDHIDHCASQIKAVNTVVVDRHNWIGFNTDGIGVMRALAKKIDIARQKIVLIGAGGAAKAIAHAALQNGANVIILNRTEIKAKQLASELGCEGYGLGEIKHLKVIKYSTLINTLPITMHNEQQMQELLSPADLIPLSIAMDIVYQPVHTSFLKIAKQANCICVPGYEMYIQQALLQIKKWFHPNENQIKAISEMMYRHFLKEHQRCVLEKFKAVL